VSDADRALLLFARILIVVCIVMPILIGVRLFTSPTCEPCPCAEAVRP
jgi:hypothetical protein